MQRFNMQKHGGMTETLNIIHIFLTEIVLILFLNAYMLVVFLKILFGIVIILPVSTKDGTHKLE